MCAMTVQRQLIFDIIKDSHEHLTADQIFCTATGKNAYYCKSVDDIEIRDISKEVE